MNSRKQKILMAGVLLATAASTFGARAADQNAYFDCERQQTDGFYTDCSVEALAKTAAATTKTAAVSRPAVESPQFEIFEHQLQITDGTAQTVTPSERVGGGR